MEILAARILIRPTDPGAQPRFYRDVLGLAVAREFPGGTVFFLGGGFLELSGSADAPAGPAVALWLQVRDLAADHASSPSTWSGSRAGSRGDSRDVDHRPGRHPDRPGRGPARAPAAPGPRPVPGA